MIVLVLLAFVAGVLTAFTPCALPILPIVLASGLEKRSRTFGTIIGLVLFFVLSTVLLSSLIQQLGVSAEIIRSGSMIVLVFLGFLLVFPNVWNAIQAVIERFWKPPTLGKERVDFFGGFLTGATLGIVWTPCVGPVVAAVTALTASSPTSGSGWAIASAYGVGIGCALWFIAHAGKSASQKLGFFKKNSYSLRKIFGVVIILTAFVILLGGDKTLQKWTLEHLPEGWTQAGSFLQDSTYVQEQLKNTTQNKNRMNK